MRLREYIDKSLEQEDPKSLLIRAIDVSRDITDMEKTAALIGSLSQNMSNEDLMFVRQYFDKVWGKFQAELRKTSGGSAHPSGG